AELERTLCGRFFRERWPRVHRKNKIMSVTDVVQRQLEAYNARDLERFVAAYGDGIRVFRLPSTQPALTGKAAFTEFYRGRFSVPALHAEILARIVLGNK